MSLASALRSRPAAWEHAPFRRLTTAWVATNIGDSALFLMAAVWVKDLTGSDGAAALVFAVLSLSTLTGPLMGQLADRVSRRGLMIAANLLCAALVSTLLLVGSAAQVWLIYVVVFGYGMVGVLTGAAQSGLLRDILPDEHLASGNGLMTTIDQSLRLVSPLLGTALYVGIGPEAVIALTVACFVLTGLLLTAVRVKETEAEVTEESFMTQVSAGFRHIWATPELKLMTLLVMVAFSVTGLVNVAVFPIIEQSLGLPTASLGILVTVQGLGAVVGGVTAATVIGRRGELWTFTAGLAMLLVAMATLIVPNVLVVAVGLGLCGWAVSWSVVAFVTLRQRLTSARMQGRTAAATMMAINVPQAVITLIGAAVIAVVDFRILVGLTLIGVAGATIAAAIGARRAPGGEPPEHPSGGQPPAEQAIEDQAPDRLAEPLRAVDTAPVIPVRSPTDR